MALLENQIHAHLSFPFFPGSEPVIHRSLDLTINDQGSCPCHFNRSLIYTGYCCTCYRNNILRTETPMHPRVTNSCLSARHTVIPFNLDFALTSTILARAYARFRGLPPMAGSCFTGSGIASSRSIRAVIQVSSSAALCRNSASVSVLAHMF